MSALRDLLTLARPRLLPFVLCLVVLGWAWAHWDRALTLRNAPGLLAVGLAWTWLHAGTLWLNAALDRDEGEVLFGRAVAPPPITVPAGYLALAIAVGVAWAADPVAGACAAVCAALAVAYSHPRAAWKGHPLGGPLVNVVGYGLLSPMAGWSVVDVAPDTRTLLVWPLGAASVLGTYFAAQAFQGEEDRRRGYRTLVATHGPVVVLGAARASLAAAVLGGMALLVAGWLPRICLPGLLAWWELDRYLRAWAAQEGGGSERWARGFARRLGSLVALGVLLAFCAYALDSFADRPVAGLGTAAGHPPDRPRLGPRAMRQWERSTGG